MFRKILKALPLLLLLCDPSLGLKISSPVIRDHADLDGLTTGDDHTQYQKESEKDGANGYAGLDGSGDIALGALPNHASNHTDGTDDLQSATSAQKGLATATQITKLDGIEPSATADQTNGEIKTAYEANANTNEFDDVEQTKLAGIETAAKDDQNASEVPFTPTGGISATDTQAAVAEVDSEAEKTANKNAVGGYAGLDGSARITKTQGHVLTVYSDQASTYTAGAKQTFQNSATTSGLKLALSADPSALVGGDVWIESSGDFKYRDNSAIRIVEIQSNKDAASGYVGLSAGSKITGSQQTYGTASDTAVEGNDARVPTTGENDALQGTTGTPSNTNRYVTDEDNRLDIHWDLKTAGEGSFEVFAGTPGIKSPNWDSSDNMGYILVTGSATDDQGGMVYEFVIPEGVTDLTEVSCTGKLGTTSEDAITVRVKREDGTQVDTGGPHQITADTETLLVINTFSGETFVPGTRFIIEVEYQGDDTETGEIGSCLVEMAR